MKMGFAFNTMIYSHNLLKAGVLVVYVKGGPAVLVQVSTVKMKKLLIF